MSDVQETAGGAAAAEAQDRINRWLDEYGKGISDHRREAVALAEQGKFEPGEVEELFDEAEVLRRAEAEARRTQGATITKRRLVPEATDLELKAEPATPGAASFKNPSVQPKDEPAAAAQPGPEAEPKAGLPAIIVPPPSSPVWEEAVAVMNKQHAIIENVGGKAVIASWEPSPIDLERLMVVFQSKESFLLRYSNRFVSVEVPNARGGSHSVTAPLGQWWLGHRDRLQFVA